MKQHFLLIRLANLFAVSIYFLLTACDQQPEKLPILGYREPVEKVVDGETVIDTIYHTVSDFSFVDQDSQTVDLNTLKGKIYVANFFFATCPTVCPKMQANLLPYFEAYKNHPEVVILSHTIDPQHDTVGVLKDYAVRMGIDGSNWRLLTGKQQEILASAQQNYFTSAMVDGNAPGGFMHASYLVLVDKNRHIRGIYEGLEPEKVQQLIADTKRLLEEKP